MVALTLHNATAIIAAAAAGSLFQIKDFQGNCLDAPGGTNSDLTPLETYTCDNSLTSPNQLWSFVQLSGNTFQISLGTTPTAILSAPLIGPSLPNAPTNLIYQQAVLRTSGAMTFSHVGYIHV